METKTDILNELTVLSPLLAEMEKVNVFTVPGEYFKSISETVLACIREEKVPVNTIVQESIQSSGVPEGYFDNLAASILSRIKAENALAEISNLSPILQAIQNKNVFEVPDGYFENFSQIITDKITSGDAQAELRLISPLLNDLREKVVFDVPAEYFNDLGGIILKKVQTQKTKVVPIFNRSLWLKYAVAAMMTGILAFGIYRYTEKPDSIEVNNSAVASLDAAIEKGKNMNDQQFNETLENLTDADIAKYLETNGNIADVVVLGNGIEASSLPSPEDYLLDETTLENYLKEIDSSSSNN